MKRLFIVDTENTNNYSFISEYKLTKSDNIVLFISNRMKGIKDDGCIELFNSKAKMLIEKVEVGEKNSLDFQIIVYVSERAFRGKYDYVYIVSNDCGYQQAINYLNHKFDKAINIINYNKIIENTKIIDEVAVSQVNENIAEIINKSIPEIGEKDILKIIDVRNESNTLIDFHNKMRKVFGDELGREMYGKLKKNIKNSF